MIVKIVGLILLAFTIHAWIKNIKIKVKTFSQSSLTDKLLELPLLFIWLAFMTAMSVGMIVNN